MVSKENYYNKSFVFYREIFYYIHYWFICIERTFKKECIKEIYKKINIL